MISTRSAAIRFGVSHTWPIKSADLGLFNSNFDIKLRRFCYNFFNRILFNRNGVALGGLLFHRSFSSFVVELFLQDVRFLDWLSKRPGLNLFKFGRKHTLSFSAPDLSGKRHVTTSFYNYFSKRSSSFNSSRELRIADFFNKYGLSIDSYNRSYSDLSDKVSRRQPKKGHLAVHARTFFLFRGRPSPSIISSYLKRLPRGWSSMRRSHFRKKAIRRFARPRWRFARTYRFKNRKAYWLVKSYSRLFNIIKKAKAEGLTTHLAFARLKFDRLRRAVTLKSLRRGRRRYKFRFFKSWLKQTTPWRQLLKRQSLSMRRRSSNFLGFKIYKPQLSRIAWRFRLKLYRELSKRRILNNRPFPHAPFPPYGTFFHPKTFSSPSLSWLNTNSFFSKLVTAFPKSSTSPSSYVDPTIGLWPSVSRLRRYLDLVKAFRIYQRIKTIFYPSWISLSSRLIFKRFIVRFSNFSYRSFSYPIFNYFKILSSGSKSANLAVCRFSRVLARPAPTYKRILRSKAVSSYSGFPFRYGHFSSLFSSKNRSSLYSKFIPSYFKKHFYRRITRRFKFLSMPIHFKRRRRARKRGRIFFRNYLRSLFRFSFLPHFSRFAFRSKPFFRSISRALKYINSERVGYPGPGVMRLKKVKKRLFHINLFRYKGILFSKRIRTRPWKRRPRIFRRRFVFFRRRLKFRRSYPRRIRRVLRPIIRSLLHRDLLIKRFSKFVPAKRNYWTRKISRFSRSRTRAHSFKWAHHRWFYGQFIRKFYRNVFHRVLSFQRGRLFHSSRSKNSLFFSKTNKFRSSTSPLRRFLQFLFSDFSFYIRLISLLNKSPSSFVFLGASQGAAASAILNIFRLRVQQALSSYQSSLLISSGRRRISQFSKYFFVNGYLKKFYHFYLLFLKACYATPVSFGLFFRFILVFFTNPIRKENSGKFKRLISDYPRKKRTHVLSPRKRPFFKTVSNNSKKYARSGSRFGKSRHRGSRRFRRRRLRRFKRFFPKPVIVYPLKFFYRFPRFSRLRLLSFYSRLGAFLARYYFGVPLRFRINLLAYVYTLDFYLNFITTRLYYRYILNDVLKPIVRLARHYYRGFRIVCNGRFTRAQMATSRVYRVGSLSSSEITAPIFYGQRFVVLKYGVCNVKIWLRF